MSELISYLDQLDQICQQIATAIQSSEPQIYPIFALVAVAMFFVFPPKDVSIKSKIPLLADTRELCGALLVELEATENRPMLGLVISLLIIALIAAALGFGGIAGAAAGIAKIIFFIFIVLFLLSLLFGGLRGGFRRGP